MVSNSTHMRDQAVRPTSIYILRHPETFEIRYVGKTVQPLPSRLYAHINDAVTSGKQTYTANWIRGLHRLGLRPVIELLATVSDDWPDHERYWIAHHKAIGCRLTNLTLGGEGVLGLVHSPETRAKISQKSKGRPAPTPETIALRVAKLKGRRHGDDTKRLISEKARARYQDPQMRQKASTSYNFSDTAKTNRLNAQRLRDPATRNALHAARLERAQAQRENPRIPLLSAAEIRSALVSISLPQKEFAKSTALSHSNVSRWIGGKIPITDWAAHRLQILITRPETYRRKDQILGRLLPILLGKAA